MMSDLSAYSECLPFLEAKKLLALMQKPGQGGSWMDWSGEGGCETEVNLDDFERNNLAELELPEFCCSFSIFSKAERNKQDMFDFTIMGGNDWMPPEYGDASNVRFYIFIEKIAAFVCISLDKAGGMRHFSRPFNYCCEFNVKLAKGSLKPNLKVPERFNKRAPSDSEVEEFIADLWKQYSLPDYNSIGWLETRKFAGSELGYYMEIECFDEIRCLVRRMIEDLIAESPCDVYILSGGASICEMADSEEMYNVTELGRDLLKRVAEKNSYASCEVSYSYLGPHDWKDREKSRKKWKKPIREQVGTLTLENGSVAEVRLVIEKEGYVFSLHFGSDEDVIKFSHSKLFQKTKWHSGAE